MKRYLQLTALLGLSVVVACTQAPTPPTSQVILADNTKVLTSSNQAALETIQPNDLRFDGPQTFKSGDVLMSDVTSKAPNGFLRKVTGVRNENGKTILETTPATLREAFKKAKITDSRDLTNADIESVLPTSGVRYVPQAAPTNPTFSFDKVLFDKDGKLDTKEDQVVLKGYVDFKLSSRFDWDIDLFPPDFDFLAEAKLTQSSGLSLKGKVAYSFEKSFDLATVRFRPINISGVIIRPIIKLTVGVRGSASGEVNFEVSQVMLITAGAKFDEEWTNLSDFSNQFSVDSSSINAAASTTAFANVTLELLLYEAVGLYVRPEIFLTADAQFPRKPYFKLDAGIGVDLGVEVDKWGIEKKYNTRIFETRYPIYSSPNSPPSITDFNFLGSGDLNRSTLLSSNATDSEDGANLTYTWASSNASDGAIPAGREVAKVFGSTGTRTITLTVRDSSGETVTRSKQINIVNTAPDLGVSEPSSAAVIYQASSYTFSANARDINEPNDQLNCSNLEWTSSVAGDGFPKTGCDVTAVFPSVGNRTLTIRATDPQGATDTETININVLPTPANQPPDSVTISSPTANTRVLDGSLITLAGAARDPEGGAVALTWQAAYQPSNGGNFTTPVALLPDGSGKVNLTAALGLQCTTSGYSVNIRVTLIAKDPQNNQASTNVIIRNVACIP